MSDAKKWVQIIRCEEIPLREGRSVRLGDRDIAVFNLGEEFVAIENRCPHMGAPLAEGILIGNLIVCPLHAYKIDLRSGRVTSPPNDVACNETFRTRLENGAVWIEWPS